MKKILLFIFSLALASGFVSAQTCPGPSQRTALINLQRAGVTESTRAGQFPLTDTCGNLRYAQYTEVNLTPIAYTPTSTGNTANLSEFVITPTGNVWYIDWQGRAILVYNASTTGDKDFLEIDTNLPPDNIQDTMYTKSKTTFGGRVIMPGQDVLVIDSFANADFIVNGFRNAQVSVYDNLSGAYAQLAQIGNESKIVLGENSVAFKIQSATGTNPVVPGAPFKTLFQYLESDTSLYFPTYPPLRDDAITPSNFLGTDVGGRLVSMPLTSIPGGVQAYLYNDAPGTDPGITPDPEYGPFLAYNEGAQEEWFYDMPSGFWVLTSDPSGYFITSSEFTGTAEPGDPLTLAQQGATVGQALAWNGTQYVPTTISGSTSGPDSTLAKTNGSYLNKRITDNVYKNGTLGIRTTDTTGILSIQLKQNTAPGISKPGIYYKQLGQNWWINQRVQNPSLGWQNLNSGDFYSGVINNGTNGAISPITDTLPNIVWRQGQNWQQQPAMYTSQETNWWGPPVLGGSGQKNVYEFHVPQVIDSGGYEHRPLTGYFEKAANGYGTYGFNVTTLTINDWRGGQNSVFSVNRNSETSFGQSNFYNDSLYTLNLSDLRQNSVAHFSAANRPSTGNPTGRANFITIGGNGAFQNVVGIGALYTDSNNGGNLDQLFTTQTGSTQFERMRIKGGEYAVGIKNTNPQQELQVGGDILTESIRANASGDSAALTLKYSSSQTTPIFLSQYNNNTTAFYAHAYNITNPSLVLGKAGTVDINSPNNTIVGLTSASFSSGAGNNTLIGARSGNSMTAAYENDFYGSSSGRNCVDCYQNFGGGYNTLTNCTSCFQNMALGRGSMQSVTTGYASTGVGVLSLASATVPADMTVVGQQAAQLATSADASVVIGAGAARQRTSISGSVIIGTNASNITGTVTNQLWIDNASTSTPLIKGDFSADTLRVFGRFKAGFETIAHTSSIIDIINNTGKNVIYRTTSNPEGAITANPGDIALSNISSTGRFWLKKTGTGNTGWVELTDINLYNSNGTTGAARTVTLTDYIRWNLTTNAGTGIAPMSIRVGGTAPNLQSWVATTSSDSLVTKFDNAKGFLLQSNNNIILQNTDSNNGITIDEVSKSTITTGGVVRNASSRLDATSNVTIAPENSVVVAQPGCTALDLTQIGTTSGLERQGTSHWITNYTGGTLTINAFAGESINNSSSATMPDGKSGWIMCIGPGDYALMVGQ